MAAMISLHDLAREHGDLPDTPRVETPNGEHHYLAAHGAVACSASEIAAGLDIRGDGGYVVAPPSIHPSGRPCEWDVHPDDEGHAGGRREGLEGDGVCRSPLFRNG
jgi:hypothetical protein